MAKIVLKQDSKSFTIITHEYSKWDLPCLGEDGRLYFLFDRIADSLGIIRDDMDFLDKEQKLCIKMFDKVQRKKEINYESIPNWDSSIFHRANGLEEYIEEWKKKHNQEW